MRHDQRFSIALCLGALMTFTGAASAAEPVAAPARADTTTKVEKTGERKPEHLRIGPLVGVGFPRPFSIEAFAKVERVIGAGVEYSFLPNVNVANVQTSFKAVALDLRVFPFRGAFFVGVRGGRQWLDASTMLNAGQYGSFEESLAASTWFVNPRLGFLHTFESGITLGIDAGVQLAVSPSYDRAGAATALGITDPDVERTLVRVSNTLGNATTPTLDLLKVGFLF